MFFDLLLIVILFLLTNPHKTCHLLASKLQNYVRYGIYCLLHLYFRITCVMVSIAYCIFFSYILWISRKKFITWVNTSLASSGAAAVYVVSLVRRRCSVRRKPRQAPLQCTSWASSDAAAVYVVSLVRRRFSVRRKPRQAPLQRTSWASSGAAAVYVVSLVRRRCSVRRKPRQAPLQCTS